MPTQHTTVKRHPERGAYDRATIDSILDEALICHLGFVADGRPFVIPTIHARDGDTLYIHGSPGSRMLRAAKQGVDICVTVTLLDGPSAKIRNGPPTDDDADLELGVWAGVIPLRIERSDPVPAESIESPPPGYAAGYERLTH